MNCLPCFFCLSKPKTPKRDEDKPQGSPEDDQVSGKNKEEGNNVENGNIKAQTFSFRELATATKNFKQECLLGEGGFGRVYKGQLKGEQTVAVKKLDRNGLQGNKEFLVEVLMLSQLHHQNLVNLIGYCADGDQRLLVYEYMPRGSLEDHLLDLEPDSKPLDWFTRMRIAVGAAEGLEYLHVKANPPVIYRDLKSSNILLDDQFSPKLSDFGLAKLGPIGEKVHVSSRVMGTYGYCAPEYTRTGQLTVQSDVYSFGVVLLELITGRRVVDPTKPIHEQNLISWAQPIFKDPRRFHEMADPRLNNDFPERGLNQAVAITAMCLQDESSARPMIMDVITAIRFLAMAPKEERMSTSSPNEAKSHDGSGSQHRGSTHDVADCSKDDNVSSSLGSYSISSGRTVENSDSRGQTGSGSSGNHSSSRNYESREGDGSTGSSNSCRSQPPQGDHTSAGSSEDGENQWVVEKCSSDFEKSCSSDRLEEGDNRRISSDHAIKEKE